MGAKTSTGTMSKSKKPLDLETLNKRRKKDKKRIEKLEGEVEELKEQVRRVDDRTLRMGMALRECMKVCGVSRPTGPLDTDV